MDTLDVLREASRRGGEQRRNDLEALIIKARDLGCSIRVGGGRVGGFNVRYGSIRYAIMDVNTKGEVKLYVQPHPNKPAPDELRDALNSCIAECNGLQPKSHPLKHHGQLEDKLEDIPNADLHVYLAEAVEGIRATYYRPYASTN